MVKDPESRRWRAKQVGMMMCAYRLSFRTEGRTGRLSQSGLLDLMGQVDEEYWKLHGRSTVARWESGTTLPTRERVEVYGEALNLSPAEKEGLIRLAGFDLDDKQRTGRSQALEEPIDTVVEESLGGSQDDGSEDIVGWSEDESTSYTGESTRFVLLRFLLPASYITGAGLVMAWFGWNST